MASAPNNTEHKEAHLPPHQRKSVTQIPVTPGVSLGTYDEDYFDDASQESPAPQTNGITDGQVGFTGNIISATFEVPHTLEYRPGSDWELCCLYQRFALFDALHYISEESPWNHTVVAWTGEISHTSEVEQYSEAEVELDILASSKPLSLGDSVHVPTRTKSNEVHVTREDQLRLERQLHEDKLSIIPVWLADEEDIAEEEIRLHDQLRWRRYAEHDLCALLHYKQHPPSDAFKEGARWADYCRMNQMFAEKIFDVYRPGDVVQVHDYHLMLLPQLLRQRYPDIRISFSMHTPFPSSELVRCLTRRKEILLGALASDVIAFQSYHYAQHFANSCSRILGLQANSKVVSTSSRRVHIEIIPAGVNVSNIHSLAWSVPATEKCLALRKLHADKKIIVACDPIDRLGGIDKKFLAFDRFLEMHPEWQERVVLLQVVSQTTTDDDNDGEESRYVGSVNALVNSINCKYGSLNYMPIQFHSQSLSTDDYFALLRSGDVALFTSIRDGMSTTSLEYVICQKNTHGCTIVSEFSGTASSLEEAIHINPWDIGGVAEQIHKALSMTAERRQSMHAALYNSVAEKDVKNWVTTIMRCLMSAVQSRSAVKGITGDTSPAISNQHARRLLART
ncbi:hypothetical protein QQS21_010806 [Conoideocrella luteorostrata]|uniref:Glycosyltransferase family 20 protein n=1 Tax=Conoideocrella luteorostrata TaxID=1105319 RepID=A0AAJ0FUB4_9HYPO|nr:hypothetical protein QQS21_010806 [Conoideocrella luteorostrata]